MKRINNFQVKDTKWQPIPHEWGNFSSLSKKTLKSFFKNITAITPAWANMSASSYWSVPKPSAPQINSYFGTGSII